MDKENWDILKLYFAVSKKKNKCISVTWANDNKIITLPILSGVANGSNKKYRQLFFLNGFIPLINKESNDPVIPSLTGWSWLITEYNQCEFPFLDLGMEPCSGLGTLFPCTVPGEWVCRAWVQISKHSAQGDLQCCDGNIQPYKRGAYVFFYSIHLYT